MKWDAIYKIMIENQVSMGFGMALFLRNTNYLGFPFLFIENFPSLKFWILNVFVLNFPPILVCSCHNKLSQTGCLKQQKCIFSQFWRLELQRQGVGRVGSFWGHSPWLVDGHLLLPVSSHCLSCVCVCVLISSHKTPVVLGQGPL